MSAWSDDGRVTAPTRRSVLLAGAAALAAGCSQDPPPRPPTTTAGVTTAMTDGMTRRTLLASFSRAGENYWYGGRRKLAVGNTQRVADLIRSLIACDVYRIEAADPYPDDYDDTVARNVREQNTDARPAIAGALPSRGSYDTVLLGSPIWNVRAPMIMSTFVEGLDLSGATVLPFVTYAVSGLGSVPEDYARLIPGATIGEGLAVQGEKAAGATADVQAWLRARRLLRD